VANGSDRANISGEKMTTDIPAAPRPGSIQAIWDHCWDVVVNHYADFSGTATRRDAADGGQVAGPVRDGPAGGPG